MKEIILKEGEEVKIQAEKGTSHAFAIMVCYKNCILHKGQADELNKQKGIK